MTTLQPTTQNTIDLDYATLQKAYEELQTDYKHKSQLLAAMSHELKTPMTAIIGYTNNMLDGFVGDLCRKQRRSLTRISKNASNLLCLMTDILNLSKIEAGHLPVQRHLVNLNDIVTNSCDTIRTYLKPGVHLKCNVPTALKKAYSDHRCLQQILTNLLSNAAKFTHTGHIETQVQRDGNTLILTVSDTGSGIPHHEQKRIFGEYEQLEETNPLKEGTGLGLAITKRFVELLNGAISVQSDEGQGTTFTVEIPDAYANPTLTLIRS